LHLPFALALEFVFLVVIPEGDLLVTLSSISKANSTKPQNVVVKRPQRTTDSPQTHHEKTTIKTPGSGSVWSE
jgi:hypothetical protein